MQAEPGAAAALATTRENRGRLVLAGVDAAAAAAGLAPGLPLADARAILPGLESRPGDPPGDEAALARLARWCNRYTPWTAPETRTGESVDGTGAIWLDVSGCAHLFGGEARLAAGLIDRLGRTGYTAAAGLADTPGAAWAAARFTAGAPGWTIVPRGGGRAFLADLPVAALRILPETAAALDTLGLRSIGALLDLPRAGLAKRFGGEVAARLDAALGAACEPLSPDVPATPDFARLEFAEPIGRTEDIAAAVARLLADLADGLARRQRGARRLALTLFEPDENVHRFAVGTSRPSRDAGHLARLFAEKLSGFRAVVGIEEMTLAAPETDCLEGVQMVFEGSLEAVRDDDAGALIDRLANRLGPARVVRLTARDSHIPERAVRALPALRAAAAAAAAWPAGPRPLRLFDRPEPIEAIAPLPDDPPVMFRWRRLRRHIRRVEGPERIAPEWWRMPTLDEAAALRDYYRVEDTEGRRYWLYRQGLYRPGTAPRWFLHGLFA